MTTPESSAITWGDRQLPYTIRRSAGRKKTVAVTVDPAGEVLVVAPERLATDSPGGGRHRPDAGGRHVHPDLVQVTQAACRWKSGRSGSAP